MISNWLLYLGVLLGLMLSQLVTVYRTLKRVSRLEDQVRSLEFKLNELWGVIDGFTQISPKDNPSKKTSNETPDTQKEPQKCQ